MADHEFSSRGDDYWRRFIESVPDGVLILDQEGVCQRLNSAAQLMLGYRCEESQGGPLHQLLHPGEDASAPECGFLRALRPENAWKLFEDVVQARGGDRLDVELCALPISSGQSGGTITLTLQNRAYQETRAASAAQAARLGNIGAFAVSAAHEFNNILMGISPFAEVIIRKAASDRQLVRAGEQIQDAVNRAKRVTAEILQSTKPAERDRNRIDVAEWLRECLTQLCALISPAIHLQLEIRDPHLAIEGDRAQLTQVITNLILNARDAIGEAGSIGIVVSRAAEPARRVRIEIVDDGGGMPPARLLRIFDPLFTTKGSSGTGLGLAVTRRIVEGHCGTIGVESTEGEGTRFTILLPEGSLRAEGERDVLILLDDEREAVSLSAFLSANSFPATIAEAGRGETASRWFAVIAPAAMHSRKEALLQLATNVIFVGGIEGEPRLEAGRVTQVAGFDLSQVLDALRAAEKRKDQQ